MPGLLLVCPSVWSRSSLSLPWAFTPAPTPSPATVTLGAPATVLGGMIFSFLFNLALAADQMQIQYMCSDTLLTVTAITASTASTIERSIIRIEIE